MSEMFIKCQILCNFLFSLKNTTQLKISSDDKKHQFFAIIDTL